MNPILVAELEKPENRDIYDELMDEKYAHRRHYSRATYADGCHGPLCRKAEKDRGRRRTEYRAEREGREYIPKEYIRQGDRDGLLNFIISWHLYHPDETERRRKAKLQMAS